jgi:hypothetical protein
MNPGASTMVAPQRRWSIVANYQIFEGGRQTCVPNAKGGRHQKPDYAVRAHRHSTGKQKSR